MLVCDFLSGHHVAHSEAYTSHARCIAEAEADPMKADVRTVEFLLAHRNEEVDAIRKTHKLSRRETEVSLGISSQTL